jgi:hypothetical protein
MPGAHRAAAVKRRLATSSDGSPLLIVEGAAGAASVEVRQGPDGAYGVMDFCSRAPVREGQEQVPCPALGHCYPVGPGFSAGVEAAGLWDSGDEEAAWVLMQEWYAAQLGAEGETGDGDQ